MKLWITAGLACAVAGLCTPAAKAQTMTGVVDSPLGVFPRQAFAQADKFYAVLVDVDLPPNNRSAAGIYRYDWTVRQWSRIGNPADQFAVDGRGKLYARARDYVAEYSGVGDEWHTIGGPSKYLYAGGSKLFSVAPATGDIYQYAGDANKWNKVGGPADDFAVDGMGRLYGGGRNGLWMYSGAGVKWDQITPDACEGMFGGEDRVFTLSPQGAVWAYAPAAREWKQWVAELKFKVVGDPKNLRRVVVSGTNLVGCADSESSADGLETVYQTYFHAQPLKQAKVQGAGGLCGRGADCLLCNVLQGNKRFIGFIKR